MTSTDVPAEPTGQAASVSAVDLRLEVVTLPVADVDRAKNFYQAGGWRLDADFAVGDQSRVVQFTPPYSEASIHFGTGPTEAAPGSADRLMLAVDHVDAARADLISRGADVSEVYHYERRPGHAGELESRVSGHDPEHERSYFAYAEFRDPDGNRWLLQEVSTRLPGRVWEE